MPINPVELLENIMGGLDLTPGHIDELLASQTPEGQFLEYKHGDQLQERNASQVIRQYVSGFANANGGLLFVGIDEQTWTVTGTEARGGHDLARWASDALVGMAGYFSPPPRLQIIRHPRGAVLMVAILRSTQVVPCAEGSRLAYYLRLHDKTLEIPDFLMADLVLGRRQHPMMDVTDCRFIDMSASEEDHNGRGGRYLFFNLDFRINNLGLALAEDVRMGMACLNALPTHQSLVNVHLASYLDIQGVQNDQLVHDFVFQHIELLGDSSFLPPFEFRNFRTGGNVRSIMLPLRIGLNWYEYIWHAAAFLISKSGPPTWYQITVRVDAEIEALLGEGPAGVVDIYANSHRWLSVKRFTGGRPIVACTHFTVR